MVRFLKQIQAPAGNSGTMMCRSKKKATQVVGWCSDTDAIIGIWILAYLERGDMGWSRRREGTVTAYGGYNITRVDFRVGGRRWGGCRW